MSNRYCMLISTPRGSPEEEPKVNDVYNLDDMIGGSNVNTEVGFAINWQQKLRYNLEESQAPSQETSGFSQKVIRQMNAQLTYGYEYMGPTSRLVITPLTDKCWITITGAMHNKLGAISDDYDPQTDAASSSKMTSLLALKINYQSEAAASPTDGLDYLAMAKFFKGLAASGAWCCFDEYNRIDLEVLSVIAQQFQSIQNAIKIKTSTFEKTELMINRACAVNITMNPGYAGRSELLDHLKAFYRPCAMMVPDYALIAQIEL